jgi:hypothetical protein
MLWVSLVRKVDICQYPDLEVVIDRPYLKLNQQFLSEQVSLHFNVPSMKKEENAAEIK